MADVVVVVPRAYWRAWIAEGALPGAAGDAAEYGYRLPPGSQRPPIDPGERVYVVAWERLRGYAPLVRVEGNEVEGWVLVRAGGAVAVTIPDPVRGFPGWRVRWWRREDEQPFERWKDENPDQQVLIPDTGAGAISGPAPSRRWLPENCPLCKAQREQDREAPAHAHQLDETCPFCNAFKVWPRGPRGLRHPERICVACGKTWHPEDLVLAARAGVALRQGG